MIATGGCLCSAVAYEVRLPFARFVNCHCSRCRRASGSAHAANAVVVADAFCWTRGGDVVRRFDLPQARSFSVAFCPTCGSQSGPSCANFTFGRVAESGRRHRGHGRAAEDRRRNHRRA